MHRARIALFGLAGFLAVLPLAAQVSFRGRIFMPNGAPVTQVLRIILTSEDARFSAQYHFTDSKGWFFLQGLRVNVRYSVTVESDGETYETTTESFFAGRDPIVNINLRPLQQVLLVPKSPGVSLQELLYKPRPEARHAYEEAVEAIGGKKTDLARAKLRRAIELDPGFVSAYNELAVLEIGAKRYAEAELLLRQALEKDPAAPHPLANLGIALGHLGRYEEALEPLRKALQLRPRWLAPKVYLGIALLETNSIDEAESYLRRGTSAAGREEALAFLYLGKLYAVKGDREKAIAAWQSYLERDSDSSNAEHVRQLLERLRSGSPQP